MNADVGTLLLEAGLVSEAQLQEGTAARLQRGGTLIENLVTLGALDADQVSQFLASRLQLPLAEAAQFQNLPTFITRLVPVEVISTHRVVPILLDQGVLHLAMSDPTERGALEEVSFTTGYTTAPVVASARLIEAAIARYYQIVPPEELLSKVAEAPLPEVVEPASGELEELFRAGRDDTSIIHLTQPKESSGSAAPSNIAEAIRLQVGGEKGPPSGSESQAPAPGLRSQGPEERQQPPEPEEPAPAAFGEQPPPEDEPEGSLEPLVDGEEARAIVLYASQRDEVARTLVRYAMSFMPRVALFMLKNDILVGWMGGGSQVSDKQIKGIMIPLASPSLFRTVRETETDYFGAIPPTTVNDIFLSALGGSHPNQCLLIPVSIRHKPICILYGDSGFEAGFAVDLSPLHLFVADVAAAFERIILNRKIGRSVIH